VLSEAGSYSALRTQHSALSYTTAGASEKHGAQQLYSVQAPPMLQSRRLQTDTLTMWDRKEGAGDAD